MKGNLIYSVTYEKKNPSRVNFDKINKTDMKILRCQVINTVEMYKVWTSVVNVI